MQLIEFLMDYYTTHNEDGSMTDLHTSADAPRWHAIRGYVCRCATGDHSTCSATAVAAELNALEAEA